MTDYDIIASHFAITRKYVWSDLLPLFARVRPESAVLDLGCGHGRAPSVLKDKRIKYLGIDQSAGLLAIARQAYPGYKFRQGDITQRRTFDKLGHYDSVLLMAVLHHILDLSKANHLMKNIYAILKSGGLVLGSVWNMRQKRYKKLKIKNNRVTMPYKVSDGRKVVQKIDRVIRDYRPEDISQLAENNGFRVLDCYYSLKGKKSNQANGHNLCFILQKKV